LSVLQDIEEYRIEESARKKWIAVPFGSHRIEMTFGSLRLLLYYNPDLNFNQSKNTIIINTF